MLFLSEDKYALNKLFLRACKYGDLELVQYFYDSDTDDLIDIHFKDKENEYKTCLHYAAEGKGDNYDVVDFLLKNENKFPKQMRTKILFSFFLAQESVQCTKVKSIREIIKRIDKLDLDYTDDQGKFSLLFTVL